jgi:branched-chain amino acid transport system ATP-binding protein
VSALLEVGGMEVAYGPSQVLFGLDLALAEGEVATLLGRNGMGKTTARARDLRPRSRSGAARSASPASASTAGEPTASAAPASRWCPEGRQMFPEPDGRRESGGVFRQSPRAREPWTPARVYGLFPRLAERPRTSATSFPAASSRCWRSAAPSSPTRAC